MHDLQHLTRDLPLLSSRISLFLRSRRARGGNKVGTARLWKFCIPFRRTLRVSVEEHNSRSQRKHVNTRATYAISIEGLASLCSKIHSCLKFPCVRRNSTIPRRRNREKEREKRRRRGNRERERERYLFPSFHPHQLVSLLMHTCCKVLVGTTAGANVAGVYWSIANPSGWSGRVTWQLRPSMP